jgi:hypothetical protein
MPFVRQAGMISGRICRVFVSDGRGSTPEGYTLRTRLSGLLGLKSSNIHIHLAKGWDHEEEDDAEDRLQQMIVNLSTNAKPPLITMGQFDPRISKMLVAMEVLDL